MVLRSKKSPKQDSSRGAFQEISPRGLLGEVGRRMLELLYGNFSNINHPFKFVFTLCLNKQTVEEAGNGWTETDSLTPGKQEIRARLESMIEKIFLMFLWLFLTL